MLMRIVKDDEAGATGDDGRSSFVAKIPNLFHVGPDSTFTSTCNFAATDVCP